MWRTLIERSARARPSLFLSNLFQRDCLDLAGLAFAAERQIARLAHQHCCFACRLEVVAWIELARILGQVTTNSAGHRQTDIGVDVDLAHAVLDAFLDFFYRHAIGFLHVAAELANFRQQFLWNGRRTVHHQMRVGDARVDFLDTVDGENVAGRLARKLVGAVRSADGDGQRVALRLLDKISSLRDVGQQLLARHLAVGAVAVFLVAHHGFQRTEHAQFGFYRDADGVRELNYLARYFDVVFVAGDRLAVFHQRTIHHDGREARLDRSHADRRRLAVVLMHDDRDVRIGFDRGFDQVAQEGFTGVLAGACGGLHDDWRANFVGSLHDRSDLLQIVDVERWQTVAVFGGVVQQLTHGYERHNKLQNDRNQYSPTLRIFRALVPPTCPIGSPQVTTIKSPFCTTPCSSSKSCTPFNTTSVSVDCASSNVRTLRNSAAFWRVATLGVMAKIGTSILCRLIHSAVEPDSVSAAIAFTRR